jgi:predicted nuclease of restriction endonuclease-like (RecB) superfamily
MATELVAPHYDTFLADLKERIRAAQVKAALAVNHQLVLLYWGIGRDILARQSEQGWGAKVIDQLAHDLRSAFPEMRGFSARNLKYMRSLAEAYPDEQFVQQAIAQIPWGHNVRILDRVKDPAEREWYLRKTIEHGWSQNVLVHQIESGLYNRQGKAQTNFTRTLPAPQSELAQQMLKDPYNFDFLRHPQDAPSIGLILCKSRNNLIVEYALRDTAKPIGVSAYELTRSLPEGLRGSLPTIEELENELQEAAMPAAETGEEKQ